MDIIEYNLTYRRTFPIIIIIIILPSVTRIPRGLEKIIIIIITTITITTIIIINQTRTGSTMQKKRKIK